MKLPKSASNTRFCHIPAGPFVYGPEVCYERLEQCPPFKPQQTVDLPEFWLAQFPVTYPQWREFLQETGHTWTGSWYDVVPGWRGTFLRAYAPVAVYPAGHDDFPIVDVTQAEAYRYCGWLSEKLGVEVTLPTEFQWEKAARGEDGRFYPWGNQKPRPEIQWQATFPVKPPRHALARHTKIRAETPQAGNPA